MPNARCMRSSSGTPWPTRIWSACGAERPAPRGSRLPQFAKVSRLPRVLRSILDPARTLNVLARAVQRQSVSGGGGIRTRVLRSFNRPSPSAASKKLSGAASLLAVEPPRIQLSVPSGSLTSLPGKPYLMASTFRSVGLRPGERRYLSSERELRLGVCFWFRLFNVVPETTARFSYIDDRSRNQSPPRCGFSS
jgi:hypothetical protein